MTKASVASLRTDSYHTHTDDRMIDLAGEYKVPAIYYNIQQNIMCISRLRRTTMATDYY